MYRFFKAFRRWFYGETLYEMAARGAFADMSIEGKRQIKDLVLREQLALGSSLNEARLDAMEAGHFMDMRVRYN